MMMRQTGQEDLPGLFSGCWKVPESHASIGTYGIGDAGFMRSGVLARQKRIYAEGKIDKGIHLDIE